MSPQAAIADHEVEASLSFIQSLLTGFHPRDLVIRLWDGTEWPAEEGQPAHFTLVLNHPGAVRRMFWHPNSLGLGEAFVDGDFEIVGELRHAFRFADYLLGLHPSFFERVRLAASALKLPVESPPRAHMPAATPRGRRQSRGRVRQAVNAHYDLPIEFWRLWLDPTLTYSCAYFQTPEDDLVSAQRAKLDRICRKLALRPGERFFDLGCGWGGLVIHAAKYFGVEAFGITLSEQQAAYANQRIEQEGLSSRCVVEARDFRDVDQPEAYEKAASIGAVEHVGLVMLPQFFAQAGRLLKPGGLFLNQGITSCPVAALPEGRSFVQRHIFPDTEFLSITDMLSAAENADFEVRDVECLREHYARTLALWLQRLEERAGAAEMATDKETLRAFRLYLAGSAHQFERGSLSIFQSLLAKPDHDRCGVPLTRDEWC